MHEGDNRDLSERRAHIKKKREVFKFQPYRVPTSRMPTHAIR